MCWFILFKKMKTFEEKILERVVELKQSCQSYTESWKNYEGTLN